MIGINVNPASIEVIRNSSEDWQRAQVLQELNAPRPSVEAESSDSILFSAFDHMSVGPIEIPSMRRTDVGFAIALGTAALLNGTRSIEIGTAEGLHAAVKSVYPYVALVSGTASLIFLKIRHELGNYLCYLKEKDSNQHIA